MDDKELINTIEGMLDRSEKKQMTLWVTSLGITVLVLGTGLWFQNHSTVNYDVFYVIAGVVMTVIGTGLFHWIDSK